MAGLGLARAAGDFITLVQLIQTAPQVSLPHPGELRRELLNLLESLRQADASPEEVNEARFALVAWADEAILGSSWSGRDDWERETLQMQLYQTAKAGNEFFDHLARLRPDQSSAREVYFLTLGLGFQGQYSGQEAERRALIAHQFEMLRATGRALETGRESPVTPSAYDLEIELHARGRGGALLYLALMVGGVALVYAALWGALRIFGTEVPLPPGL